MAAHELLYRNRAAYRYPLSSRFWRFATDGPLPGKTLL